jgi:phosphoglycerol transferase MdoB-like AlkP superfamily enzyme
MFQRSTWYPNVGFERTLFSDALVARGARRCAGVFPGACDRDLPRILAGELKAAREPQLLYWLTVNSHMPVAANATTRTERCEAYSASLAADYPMACRLISIYDDVANALAAEMIAEDFPPTDVLLVGDHMPPFFDRWNRSQFDSHHVPWVLLSYKGHDNHPGNTRRSASASE